MVQPAQSQPAQATVNVEVGAGGVALSLRGRVVDDPVPGAVVTVSIGGFDFVAVADAQGNYEDDFQLINEREVRSRYHRLQDGAGELPFAPAEAFGRFAIPTWNPQGSYWGAAYFDFPTQPGTVNYAGIEDQTPPLGMAMRAGRRAGRRQGHPDRLPFARPGARRARRRSRIPQGRRRVLG